MFPDETCRWVPVALSPDVPLASVIPIETADGGAALWRSQTGKLSIAADRCPHRGMRLSHGFVRGEALSCIYHGWSYDGGGKCLRIPAHPSLTPPETIRVRTSAVRESGGVIWTGNDDAAGDPPLFTGHEPLRSLTLAATEAALFAAIGPHRIDRGALACLLGGQAALVLATRRSAGDLLLHVLVPAETDTAARIAVSRGCEALRRQAEQIDREKAA